MQLHEVLWPNKCIMVALGLWPLNLDETLSRRRRFFIYLKNFVTMFSVISLVIPLFATVIVNQANIKILGDYGAMTIIITVLALRLLYYIYHRKKFLSIYQYIEDFWKISDNPRERESYENQAKLGKIVTIVIFLAAMSDIVMFNAVAMINYVRKFHEINNDNPWPLLLNLTYGFDTQKTPVYEVTFIYQNICMIYAACAVVGSDCDMMTLVLHISGQFRLINYRFRAIGRKIYQQIDLNDDEIEIDDDIANLIAHHQHVIKVTEELDALLSPLIFGQIVTSAMVICLSGYSVIEGSNNAAELVKFLLFWILSLAQLGLWCFPAEILIKESSAIADTIYLEIPWIRLTPRQRRDLSFIIARTQKACRVTAFYQTMSHRTLTEVINAAAAYMAVLRNVKK